MKKFLILFLVAISVGVIAQESVLLRLKYNKGDQYVMDMKMKQTMSVGVETTTTMQIKNTVIDVKNQQFIVDQQTGKTTVDANYMGKILHYDSTMKAEEMDEQLKAIDAQMKPFLTSVFTFTYNDLGEILDAQLKSGNANAEMIKRNNRDLATVYPKEKMKIGSSWSKKIVQTNGAEMNKTYTVSQIDKKFVYMNIEGIITGTAIGSLKGKMKINRATGVLEASHTENTINMMEQEVKTEINIFNKKM